MDPKQTQSKSILAQLRWYPTLDLFALLLPSLALSSSGLFLPTHHVLCPQRDSRWYTLPVASRAGSSADYYKLKGPRIPSGYGRVLLQNMIYSIGKTTS